MRFIHLLLAAWLGLLLGGCDYMKLLNVRYDPITSGAPRYSFSDRAPVAVVLPFRPTSTTHYGPYHVGEFYSTFGTLEDRAFAEQSVSDIVAGGMADELNYGGFTVLELPSREAAIAWSAKLSAACQCDQELREFMYDPAS